MSDQESERTEYTFVFDPKDEGKFRQIMERLDPEEFTVIKEIGPVDPEKPKECDLETIMEMVPEACLTFRLGMKSLRIRRYRSEEEEAERKAMEDRHKVKIRVYTGTADKGPMST